MFAPDAAHWFFPCFDQPDLKATWKLDAVVHYDWVVVSNDLEDPRYISELNINPNIKKHKDRISKKLDEIAKSFGLESYWEESDPKRCFCF